MAMQLDADIEFKIASQRGMAKQNDLTNAASFDESIESSVDEMKNLSIKGNQLPMKEGIVVDSQKSLYEQFQALVNATNQYCDKNYLQKVSFMNNRSSGLARSYLKYILLIKGNAHIAIAF
jgi:hypothetical protein